MTLHPMMIMHDFEALPEGSAHAEWPLHFTVVPYFTADALSKDFVLEAVAATVKTSRQFPIHFGEEAMFGPDNDIEVTKLIDSKNGLDDLHHNLMRTLGDIGCTFSDLSYTKDNYAPHVSHKSGKDLPEGMYVPKNITVVSKLPKSVGPQNKIIEAVIPIPRFYSRGSQDPYSIASKGGKTSRRKE